MTVPDSHMQCASARVGFGLASAIKCLAIAIAVTFLWVWLEPRLHRPYRHYRLVDSNNMFQIAKALEEYSSDNGGYLPAYRGATSLSLALMPKYVTKEVILRCPYIVKPGTRPRAAGEGLYLLNERCAGKNTHEIAETEAVVYEPWLESMHPKPLLLIVVRKGTLVMVMSDKDIHPDNVPAFDVKP